MSSTYKFKVGDIVEHIGGRGNTGKVTRVTVDKITVVFEDSSKDYNYNSNTRSLRLVKEKTVHKYPIYKKSKTNGVVVHFTALESGFVTERGDTLLDIGCYSSSWTPHTSDDQWEDYTPEPRTKHICEVLEEKVNLETAIRFAKNYTEWANSKDYLDSRINASSLINSFLWEDSKEGGSFWNKIDNYVAGIKATATYSTFTKYAKMALPEEVEEIKEQEVTYPIYKKYKHTGVIVKFIGLQEGIVVVEGWSGQKLNYYATSWEKCTNTHLWEDCDYKETEEQVSSTKEPKIIQTKTESIIMTKLKTTATSVATQNKDAIKVAAKLEAGKIINKQVIKQVKPHLPLLVRGLADHPAASIVLANVVSIAVKHFMPENKKLNTVAELMLGAAAVNTVASFNIEAFVEDLLKNIKLPTGALDDDN